MKDLLEPVLKLLPSYLPDLISLVSRPKTMIRRWTEDARGDLTPPLTFVAVSVALGFLLQLPQLGKEADVATLAAGMAVFKVLALVLFAAIIHVMFKMVGGRANFAVTFSAYLYVVSPLYLMLLITEIAALGILRAYNPAVSAAERLEPGQLMESAERMRAFAAATPALARAYSLLIPARALVGFGWLIACWGAFRQLHAVTRWRSTLVGFATLAAAAIFFPALNYVLLGMFGLPTPTLR